MATKVYSRHTTYITGVKVGQYTSSTRHGWMQETCNKVWMDKTIKSHGDAFLKGLSTGPKNPTGKSKWLIVVHIRSVEGFVKCGLLCFESKKYTAMKLMETPSMTGFEEFFLNWKIIP